MAKLSVSTDRIYMEKISLFSSTDLPTEVAEKRKKKRKKKRKRERVGDIPKKGDFIFLFSLLQDDTKK